MFKGLEGTVLRARLCIKKRNPPDKKSISIPPSKSSSAKDSVLKVITIQHAIWNEVLNKAPAWLSYLAE